jgi:NAD(P)-dependent dehydrogenase (short-subunit alcohol dehydrogenase family)
MPTTPIALVTGANRGIGYEVCRQLAQQGYRVLLGSRDAANGEAAAQTLQREGLNVAALTLDVSQPESISQARAAVERDEGRLDVLVNNAAINYDTWQRGVTADLDVVQQTMETNVYGALRMMQTFLPLLRKSAHGRIVNVSSEAGSLAGMGGGTPAYSMSKAALNALTRIFAAELRGDRILVNSVCPGWVATDMGGSGGRPVRDGAASVLWAATLKDDGPTGGFFRDGKPLKW